MIRVSLAPGARLASMKFRGFNVSTCPRTILAIVRQTNPTRRVIIGPTQWNSREKLDTLKLPENDRNILVTFHYYDPFHFTHQGATWAGEEVKKLSGITWGSDADRAQLKGDFDTVAAWAAANQRPILLGEFGAYDKTGTPEAMRAAYIEAVAREADPAIRARLLTDLTGPAYVLVLELEYDHYADLEPARCPLTQQAGWKPFYQQFIPLCERSERTLFKVSWSG
jgi:hypothetical protein